MEFHKEGRKVAELELVSSSNIGRAGFWSSIKKVLEDTLF
jgi:hypothetical protein